MQLVINTFGTSIHRKKELFVFKIEDRKVELAARKIHSILITTGVHFSSDTILLATEHNIDIVMLDKYGKPYGRFWNGKMGSTAAIRRAQLEYSESEKGLEIVKNWAVTKLKNQEDFLKELMNRRPGSEDIFQPAIIKLTENRMKLKNLKGDIHELRSSIMGLEGSAAASYWKVLGQLPPEQFKFKTRSRHPAGDPVNAMINYAYGVLYSKVERACIIAGLDPYIGFLHTDNYNKKSLVFDMIEIFRIYADRTVLKLFTGRQCKKNMFRKESSGSMTLNKAAKELLLNKFNEFLDSKVKYKVKNSKTGRTRQIKRLDTIQAEAHTLANSMIGKETKDIPEIKEVKELFE
ncbi:MAG: CRISPR-associated endonuclease Cas1 [Victivallales bacterium]|nr:CRISPR-associated endonuclease Cas1 [Victivallales bacterium]MCF7888742.1 CRISPR-associated endonuclease Cas1 [Victivallales bacterium]